MIRALPDDTRCSLTSLLDDYDTRSRPFKSPLNVHLSDLDVLLFGLQIASGMNFLTNSGVSLRELVIVIRPDRQSKSKYSTNISNTYVFWHLGSLKGGGIMLFLHSLITL